MTEIMSQIISAIRANVTSLTMELPIVVLLRDGYLTITVTLRVSLLLRKYVPSRKMDTLIIAAR